jgi:hypothetical protein
MPDAADEQEPWDVRAGETVTVNFTVPACLAEDRGLADAGYRAIPTADAISRRPGLEPARSGLEMLPMRTLRGAPCWFVVTAALGAWCLVRDASGNRWTGPIWLEPGRARATS